jgi:hypothetical protein
MNSVFTEIKKSELVTAAYQSAEIEGLDVGKIEELFEVWKKMVLLAWLPATLSKAAGFVIL